MISCRKCFILFILNIFLFQCTNYDKKAPPNLIEIHGRTMGTTYMVKVVKAGDSKAAISNERSRQIKAGIDELLKTVNRQMSTWLKDSEISRFNGYRETQWFGVSSDTVRVITEALRVSEISNGAFDITVGPLINLWGFGPAKQEKQIPDDAQIKEVLTKIGFRKLSVRQSPPSIKKEEPVLYCSLSAIAKGFGVDKVAEYLESRGFLNYLVEIGGEVRARGINHKGQIWRIGIETPDSISALQKIVLLKDMSMATSGDYHNYFEKDGVRYSHTIDPTTGRPIAHKLASVSVIHKSCMTADAMATAIDVLGPVKGYDLGLKENLAVFMVVREKDGFVEKMTPQFNEILRR